MKDVSVREPFDRGYLGVSALYGEQEARAHRRTVEQDGARAADAVLATEMRTVKAEPVS